MKYAYPAMISYDKALLMACDALSLYLESLVERKLVVLKPSDFAESVLIEPRAGVSFALWLRAKRKAAIFLIRVALLYRAYHVVQHLVCRSRYSSLASQPDDRAREEFHFSLAPRLDVLQHGRLAARRQQVEGRVPGMEVVFDQTRTERLAYRHQFQRNMSR